jgi:hypothetical protein
MIVLALYLGADFLDPSGPGVFLFDVDVLSVDHTAEAKRQTALPVPIEARAPMLTSAWYLVRDDHDAVARLTRARRAVPREAPRARPRLSAPLPAAPASPEADQPPSSVAGCRCPGGKGRHMRTEARNPRAVTEQRLTAAHTPGPWQVRPGERVITAADDNPGQAIAWVLQGTACEQGNARLIAAAPALYAELTACLHYLVSSPDPGAAARVSAILALLERSGLA